MFLSDGGNWIGPWIAKTYPDSTHILDLFHVLEKVAVVAQDAPKPEQWFEQQKQALLASELPQVLAAIEAVVCRDKVQQGQIQSYLVNHSHQMDYALYRSKGWMVSTGLAHQWPHRIGPPSGLTSTDEAQWAALV